MKYTPGQQVYFSRNTARRGSDNRWLMIKSVGRKWVWFENSDNWKVENGTNKLIVDGYGQIGTVWESEEAYRADQELQRHRNELITKLDRQNWCQVSIEKLEQIANILEVGQ